MLVIELKTWRKHPVLRDPKAAEKGMDARWAWSCDDPRSLERTGLEVRQSATITRPPGTCAAGCRSGTGTSSRSPIRSWAGP
jgi:hypothetical protein